MRPSRSRPTWPVTRRCLSVGTLVTLLLTIGSVAGGAAFSGALVSSATRFSSATLQLSSKTGSTSCYSTGTGTGGSVSTNSTACLTGSPLPNGSLSTSSSASATAVLGSPGAATASTTTVSSSSCGVAQLADAETSTNWSGTAPDAALSLDGLTYQASGPLGSQSITTDGSTGWAETTKEYTDPETFTVLAWFKTSSPTGSILGFSNNQTAPSAATNYDRMLWIDPTGHVVWGVYNGATYEAASSAAYDNGSWHFVAASVGSAGEQLYVDGALVGSSTNTSAQTGYGGWWSIGLSGVVNGGWSDSPSSAYFNGSIAQVAVIPSQLTAAQVTNLYSDSTVATYSAGVTALNPANYWTLNDSGSTPYTASVPGAASAFTDASGNGNTGSGQGVITTGGSGPTSLGASADGVALDGSSGYVETTTSYANPEGLSEIGWFKASGTAGGTIMGFTNVQSTGTPSTWDRMIWIDNTGHLVYGTYNGATQEVTSPGTYNNGLWHFVVAEIGASGQQLWVDGSKVASNSAYTMAQNYTGYWHLGWGYESTWPDSPTNNFLSGSLSEVAIVPSQLTSSQITSLYGATSTSSFATSMGSLAPTSYWPLQNPPSSVCGTTEVTVQQTVGTTKTCIYPAAAGACPAPAAAYLITGLGTRSIAVPTSTAQVTVTTTMELSAASPVGVLGLHELPGISFNSTRSSTLWSAAVTYPSAWVQL